MKQQLNRALARSIHIKSAPSVTIPSSIGIDTAIKTDAQAIESSTKSDLERPQFQALGNPPTIVSVSLAPSLPVYIQKGSLLSIYGGSINNITSSITWLNPLKRVIYGFHSFRYQKLESTKIATALISSSKQNDSTVATLSLNGSVDWALLPNDSVLAYSGSALRISTETIPRFVKQDGWFKFGEVKTGLYSPWRSGYTLVSGRGDVVVQGRGSIYRVELGAEEEVLIRKNNVVGISVNGDELSRCVSDHKYFNSTKEAVISEDIEATDKEVSTEIKKDEVDSFKQVKQIWSQIQHWTSTSLRFLGSLIKGISDDRYVQIKGPRTVLLQSDLQTMGIFNFQKNSNSINIVESHLQKASVDQTSAKDYLSYVTVDKDGKVKFESTPDFQETVKRLEAADTKK